MKSKFIFALMAAALVSCSGNKTAESVESNEEIAQTQEPQISLQGKWRLADYAGETEIAAPDSTENYYLQIMPDGTFGMSTDCNSIGGNYTVSNDSLTFSDIAMTQMACPNENVERAMATILPQISTYSITPDSVLSLRADARIMARFTPAK